MAYTSSLLCAKIVLDYSRNGLEFTLFIALFLMTSCTLPHFVKKKKKKSIIIIKKLEERRRCACAAYTFITKWQLDCELLAAGLAAPATPCFCLWAGARRPKEARAEGPADSVPLWEASFWQTPTAPPSGGPLEVWTIT